MRVKQNPGSERRRYQASSAGKAEWLPLGKQAAVCLSIDDVHPSTSGDSYEAGGDLGAGTLGLVERLLDRHPQLHVTLFVTPEWRPRQLVAKPWRAHLPFVAERVHHVDLHPDGRFRVDRHPEFVRYLNALPRCEIAPHGLHHIHRGRRLAVEFQEQDRATCVRMLREATTIFEAAGLRHARGFSPPGWNLPIALIDALTDLEFAFVSSARDLRTDVHAEAIAAMSGLRGVALTRPQRIGRGALQHVPINFQATSDSLRAHALIECNGVLSIKAHAFKHGGGHTMLDGLDGDYCSRLDALFRDLESSYGDSLWWTTMSAIAAASGAAFAAAEAAPPG
jgi:hypothetical protein